MLHLESQQYLQYVEEYSRLQIEREIELRRLKKDTHRSSETELVINAQLNINASKAQQMPRSELNVTHPHFLRNTLAAKQGITNFSEHQSLENRTRFERNPYSSKLR